MKTKVINLMYREKRKSLEVKIVPKWFEGIGLMFSRREKARALLFNFKKPVGLRIHSYFVFYPFVALWLDDKMNILELKIVKPFSIGVGPRKKFKHLIEVPINKNYDAVVKMLVGGRETFK